MSTEPETRISSVLSADRVNSIAGTLHRNIPDPLVPNVCKIPYRRWRARHRIGQLDITDSGRGDPYPYVTLESGATLHGFPSKPIHHSLHAQLRDDQQDVLVPEAYFTAEQVYLSLKRGHFNREEQYTIQPGDTVVDIGPHHGYYTYQLAERVGEDGRVIAIEAHPDNYDVLSKNVEANNLKNVTTVNKAVAEDSRTVTFYERETHSGKHHTVSAEKYEGTPDEEYSGIDVECANLDSILEEIGVDSIDFASLTVNKAEYEVLKGMQSTLNDGTAMAAVGSANVNDILTLLDEYGYETTVSDEYFVSPIIYGTPANE